MHPVVTRDLLGLCLSWRSYEKTKKTGHIFLYFSFCSFSAVKFCGEYTFKCTNNNRVRIGNFSYIFLWCEGFVEFSLLIPIQIKRVSPLRVSFCKGTYGKAVPKGQKP